MAVVMMKKRTAAMKFVENTMVLKHLFLSLSQVPIPFTPMVLYCNYLLILEQHILDIKRPTQLNRLFTVTTCMNINTTDEII